jgi:hypothetical protein
VETLRGRRRPVGVEGDHRVGTRPIRDRGAIVHARADPGVIGPGQHDLHAARGQRITDPQCDIPIEGVLGIAAVGGGAGGVARLGATPTVGNRAVDLRWV